MNNTMEISGTLLAGCARACINLKIVAGVQASNLIEGIQPLNWYPLERLQKLGDIITSTYDNPVPIMEQVGIEMMTEWYNFGTGKNLIKKGADFIVFQTGSEGYKSVVKDPSSFIGDFKLISFDEKKGEAVIESSTPFNRDMERGVLIGGMKALGDLDYIEVNNEKNKDIFIITFYKAA